MLNLVRAGTVRVLSLRPCPLGVWAECIMLPTLLNGPMQGWGFRWRSHSLNVPASPYVSVCICRVF